MSVFRKLLIYPLYEILSESNSIFIINFCYFKKVISHSASLIFHPLVNRLRISNGNVKNF
ncbi:MAG: hypothetical protein AUK34_04520 [Ignavibacteria bacterium CG2_30_36_16]|nr:MAG: hypothetical protein AUK34_04520 [Ignavibacteria bacterium CG2_30_36_16]